MILENVSSRVTVNGQSMLASFDIVWDEFLPIVKFKDPENYEVDEEELTLSDEEVELSDYLDADKRTFKVWQLSTEKRKFKLPFTIKQGGAKSKDDDGLIDIKISEENDPNIKLIGDQQIDGKYDTEIEVEIEIKGDEDKEFYIDFYANDNTDDKWNTGEYKDVHCGRVKVVFDYCVCNAEDWPTLAPMVDEASKVRYGSSLSWESSPECYHYALEELKGLGYWVKSERWNKMWDGTKEVNDHIYQLYVADDVAGMTSGYQEDGFNQGMEYLKTALKSSIPIMVGLDYHGSYANDDLTTDHFAVIVGTGKENGKIYFDICDNAYTNSRYYCDCKNKRLYRNDGGSDWIITQIRESKKL